MLSIEEKFPDFALEACVSPEHGKVFTTISMNVIKREGKRVVTSFWQKDFTFVCPTEIKGFDDRNLDFRRPGAVLVGSCTKPLLRIVPSGSEFRVSDSLDF